MKYKYSVFYLVLVCLLSLSAQAIVNVVTTTTDLASVTRTVGGEFVSVNAIAKGTQDPHFIEAKPSYMLLANKADLLIASGLDLEVGWLPSVVRGARNPKLSPGSQGYLEIGPSISPIDIATEKVSRAEGDVHPFGNPHFTLDPIRLGQTAQLIAERLSQIDPDHSQQYKTRAEQYSSKLALLSDQWRARIHKTGITQVVTYHKTLDYFMTRMGINIGILLEPKPGIPPTSGHILKVIQTMKENHISLILIENFFDDSVTKKIKNDIPSLRSYTVPVSVEGSPDIKTSEDLFEHLVQVIEGKLQ